MASKVRGRISYQRNLKKSMEDNMREVYNSSDNPAEIKTDLLYYANSKDCDFLALIMRSGWMTWKQQMKDQVVNYGVVAALVLSVVLGLAVAPLTPNTAKDAWADRRESFADLYLIILLLSSSFAFICIVISLVQVVTYDQWALDLDDFIYQVKFFKNNTFASTSLIICAVLGFLAVPFGGVVILADPHASIIFYASVGLAIVLILFVIFAYGTLLRRSYKTFVVHKDTYIKVIEDVYAECTQIADEPGNEKE